MTDINLKVQLTPQDYADAQHLHRTFRFYLIVGVLVLAAFSSMVFFSGNSSNFMFWMFAIFLWLCWITLFYVAERRGVLRRATKVFAQQKTLRTPYESRITDEKWYTRSEIGEGRISWEDLHKWKGNENLILVYQSDRMFHMFPRRFFASNDEFQSFKELLTKTIGPAGKAKKR